MKSSASKPRSDAKLLTLPEPAKHRIWARLTEPGQGYRQVVPWIKREFDVSTSEAALSTFWAEWVGPRMLRGEQPNVPDGNMGGAPIVKKPFSSGKWLKLSEMQRHQLWAKLLEPGIGYRKASLWAKQEFGVSISRSALGRFWQSWVSPRVVAGHRPLTSVDGDNPPSPSASTVEVEIVMTLPGDSAPSVFCGRLVRREDNA